MKSPPTNDSLSLMLALGLATLVLPAHAQTFVPLDFSNNKQAVNAIYPNNSTLGPEYYNGSVFEFYGVGTENGQSIDARVSLVSTSGAYELVGWLPDYDTIANEPAGDLGVYWRARHRDFTHTGGITWKLEFFAGGTEFATAMTLSAIRLLIYDHDGEATQSEHLRVFTDDGFTGYQLRDGSGIVPEDNGTSWNFHARGQNHPETNDQGGMILHFANTSSIRFEGDSTTSDLADPWTLGIFTAIDGDLSQISGNTANYSAFVPIPEPGPSTLLMAAAAAFLRRYRTLPPA